MLVLTRGKGESFTIGDDITVQVLDFTGTQVRLGIEAPRHVEVHRAEVLRRIAAQRKQLESKAKDS